MKRQKCPEWSEEQEKRQKKCLRKMNQNLCASLSPIVIIMDDELCFPLKHDKVSAWE